MESSSQESSALYDESKTDGGKSFELGLNSESEYSGVNSNSLDMKMKWKKSNIGSKETQLVKISKYAVLTFMVIACTACAVVVYLVTSNAQEDRFVQKVGKKITIKGCAGFLKNE
jgi:hypothetical protein